MGIDVRVESERGDVLGEVIDPHGRTQGYCLAIPIPSRAVFGS